MVAECSVHRRRADIICRASKTQGLVSVLAQGKHRYYRIGGCDVAAALEALTVVAGAPTRKFRTEHADAAARGANLL